MKTSDRGVVDTELVVEVKGGQEKVLSREVEQFVAQMKEGVEGGQGLRSFGESELSTETNALIRMREKSHEFFHGTLAETFAHELGDFGGLGMRLVGIESDDPSLWSGGPTGYEVAEVSRSLKSKVDVGGSETPEEFLATGQLIGGSVRLDGKGVDSRSGGRPFVIAKKKVVGEFSSLMRFRVGRRDRKGHWRSGQWAGEAKRVVRSWQGPTSDPLSKGWEEGYQGRFPDGKWREFGGRCASLNQRPRRDRRGGRGHRGRHCCRR